MPEHATKLLVVICGPTAVGKTALTIELARHFNSEILSADSRQFYRELVIGSAMPSQAECNAAPHHFIGQLSIQQSYNVSTFEQEAIAKLTELFRHHDYIFMAGGSGLYIDAVCRGIDVLPDPDPGLREELKNRLKREGLVSLQEELQRLDPDYYRQVDLKNPARLIRALEVCRTSGRPYSSLRRQQFAGRSFAIQKIGLHLPKEVLMERIRQRTKSMLDAGLEAEARSLLPFRHLNALNTVGYKEMFGYFDGQWTLDEAIEKIITNTWRYAKRQMTWFRRDPEIRWYSPQQADEIIRLLQS